MQEPARLYLLVGLPGAGKTTKARQLAVEASALRLTPDEWMLLLWWKSSQHRSSGQPPTHPTPGRRHIRKAYWRTSPQLFLRERLSLSLSATSGAHSAGLYRLKRGSVKIRSAIKAAATI